MKTERMYLITTPENKKHLQEVANRYFEGNLSAVFEFRIERFDMHLEGKWGHPETKDKATGNLRRGSVFFGINVEK
ncbi:hypothetical protein [Paenibacillus sp. TSA_86.1]|uniref:hypothetical protein n=1 Tax=Paenibacillus sp. TSA_86.1 TaxID=3415649 RepID=UPI004046847D